MTVYVALDEVRAGKLTLDTPLVMSARAARMPPSKMGFRPGTQVTLQLPSFAMVYGAAVRTAKQSVESSVSGTSPNVVGAISLRPHAADFGGASSRQLPGYTVAMSTFSQRQPVTPTRHSSSCGFVRPVLRLAVTVLASAKPFER